MQEINPYICVHMSYIYVYIHTNEDINPYMCIYLYMCVWIYVSEYEKRRVNAKYLYIFACIYVYMCV